MQSVIKRKPNFWTIRCIGRLLGIELRIELMTKISLSLGFREI